VADQPEPTREEDDAPSSAARKRTPSATRAKRDPERVVDPDPDAP
jgi:hypothetical protein